jgi:two-component system sensor histidine kinase UhpB
MTLTTDPRNEIAEVWGQTRDAFAAMIVFCAGTGLLVYLFAIRSFRALPEFGRALGNVAEGEYGTKLSETGPPEFARLAHGYNKMAERLSQYERENERLQSQIMKVQEEERAEIARDLHDEVGPFLFSINVDAAAIPDLATSQKLAAVEERSGRIGQAAGHIQQSVKSILRQLKPVDVLDFGLDTAIRELFSFWQARTPDLRLELRYALAGQTLARDQEEAIYRVVQESLSNAVRHGRPASIVVSLTMDADAQLVVVIEDDGSGLPPRRSAGGAGLDGMAGRMRGLGGRLSVRNKAAGSGVIVTAILPLAAKGET